INPYVALETYRILAEKKHLPQELDYSEVQKRFIKATNKAILKVTAKMGISTIQSYRGAQIFEAIGIAKNVIDRYFTGTVSRINGVSIDVIAREAILRHQTA